MGPRIRNESGESKKNVFCGICNQSGRRDNMKRNHFPRKHPGKQYFERGDRVAKSAKQFFVARSDNSSEDHIDGENPKSDDEIMNIEHVESDDLDDEDDPMNIETEIISEVERDAGEIDEVRLVETPSNLNEKVSSDDSTIKRIENLLSDHLLKLKLFVDKNSEVAVDKETTDVEIDNIVLKLKSCRSMEDLCAIGGFSMFRGQNKVICDLCDEASDKMTNKGGEFCYDFEENGIDFNDSNMPRKFRAFKERIINHLATKAHKEAVADQEKNDAEEASNEINNYKVGLKLGSIVYQNIKERCSYAKYERDVAAAAFNGEEVGNINHGEDFAKNLTDDMGTEAKIQLTKYFHKPLSCTGQLPPVMFGSDKMTMKKKTGHIAGVITPDVSAPISEPFLKPVFLAMPIARFHDGEGLSKQILQIMQLFLSNVSEQVQGISNDRQYVHLNIKKHLESLVPEFKDQEKWILFSWDPAHRIALASNDASKDNKDGSKKEGSLKDVFELVQKINKHVGYGKHNLELETILKDLGITDKNKPLTFSDTRFPQFAYFVLRNFLNSYPALIQQIEYELSYTKVAKAGDLKDTLKEATSIEFVVKVAGAADIFRRQQILSQQAQRVDQLISDVYGNITLQKEKLEQMNKELESDKHPDNWTSDDLDKLDDHLWVETKKAIKEIVETKSYKEVVLKRNDKEDIGIAVVELRNHLNRNIFALTEHFDHDFYSDFIQEVKDVFDFN